MDLKELKNRSKSELHRALAEGRDKLRVLRFKEASKQLKDVREIRLTRKLVARVLTLLNVKEKNNK